MGVCTRKTRYDTGTGGAGSQEAFDEMYPLSAYGSTSRNQGMRCGEIVIPGGRVYAT